MCVFSCSCPVGFEGPRCQQTKITFSGNSGYVVLKPLESCQKDKVSFEFMTTTSTGSQLLFYTGPITDSDSSVLKDFMAVELVSGYPQLRLNLGDGELRIPASLPSVSLSDGNWHSVEVFRMGKVSCMRCLFFAVARLVTVNKQEINTFCGTRICPMLLHSIHRYQNI